MYSPSKIEINQAVKEYLGAKIKLKKRKTKKNKIEFEKAQKIIIEKTTHLVIMRCNKYKMFPNYSDLLQEGYEGLLQGLLTFDNKKGDFCWWANKYIKTRITRLANKHSTIHVPMHKTKFIIPHKVSKMPEIVDLNDPENEFEDKEIQKTVRAALKMLPIEEQQVITSVFEFYPSSAGSVSQTSRNMNVSRTVCETLLNRAKENFKNNLSLINNKNNE